MARDSQTGVSTADGADAVADSDGGDPAEGPSSLPEALGVRRNARIGLVVGTTIAALLYLRVQAGLGWELSDTALYYLSLAFVAAVSIAFVVTGVLCAKAGLAPVLDRSNWLRRGGTAAVTGGLLWASLPALAALAGLGVTPEWTWQGGTIVAALALAVGAAGVHAAIQEASGSIERVAYVLVLGGLLLAAGNATGNPAPTTETEFGVVASPFLLSAFVAFVATVPFAATADLSGRLGARASRALLAGSLVGALAVAGLVYGGWDALEAATDAPVPIALALVAAPTGIGWVLAGRALRRLALLATDDDDHRLRPPDEAGTPKR